MSDVAKCEKCSTTTVQHCDENNCGHLGAGNGEPVAPPYDGLISHPLDRSDPELAVWYGKMPESNGKSNWTAILYRKGGEGSFMGRLSEGITIDRSEYEDRVRYEADRMRYLIGELDQEPDMLAYDEKLRSAYVYPPTEQQIELAALRRQLASAAEQIEELQVAGRRMAACGEDLLERLVNVTEGSDDPVSDDEISEIKETLGIAGEDD